MEIAAFFILVIVISFVDIKSMVKLKLKKEIIPYLGLMLITGVAGFLFLADPYRKSISYLILKIFNIQE